MQSNQDMLELLMYHYDEIRYNTHGKYVEVWRGEILH